MITNIIKIVIYVGSGLALYFILRRLYREDKGNKYWLHAQPGILDLLVILCPAINTIFAILLWSDTQTRNGVTLFQRILNKIFGL
jgi:hypothetical protein